MKSLTLIYRGSILDFDVRRVSCKFISPPIEKIITDAVYFISSAKRTVTFLTTVDVLLEKYNNYLPNNK